MLIDSVIIKLIRNGGKEGPDYNLTIYGHGAVVYEGKNNVKSKGTLEEPIEEKKIMSLLSEFKLLDFFSLNEFYIMDGTAGRPYTVISLSLPVPGKEDQVKTKNIMYYDEDPNVPPRLKKLSDVIDEIVESDRWVSFSPKPKPELQIQPEVPKKEIPPAPKVSRSPKKYRRISTKSIIMIITIVAIIAMTVFAISTGILNINPNDDQDKDNGNGDNGDDPPIIDYEPPDITILRTIDDTSLEKIADYLTNDQDPPKTDLFEQGDMIHVYYKFKNVTHNARYNIVEDVTISYSGAVKDHYSETFENETEYITFYDVCSFETDESWLTGVYMVNLCVEDLTTEKISSKTTTFTIV